MIFFIPSPVLSSFPFNIPLFYKIQCYKSCVNYSYNTPRLLSVHVDCLPFFNRFNELVVECVSCVTRGN